MAYRQGYQPQSRPQQRPANGNRSRAAANGRPATRAKRRKKSRPLVIFLVLVVVAFLATVGVMGYMMYEEVAQVERANTFYPGVYVDNIPLYGATPQEAYNYLVNQARSTIQDWKVTLRYGDSYWEITPDLLGMNSSIESIVQEEVNKAFFIGRDSSSILERYQTIADLKENPYQGYTSGVEKNTARIDSIIAEIEQLVYQPAQDATWAFDASRRNPVVITQEVYGQQLNASALKERIIGMVQNMDAGTIQIETQPIEPAVLASSLQNKVVLLGSYESPISSTSTENRNMNIQRGMDAFHGKTVQPDERVSFNTWVGKRTQSNGFYEALEVVDGEYKMGYGGGICQVSSALYNAVVRANLRVRERTNHAIPVNYMEMGADATVYDGRIDFVFQNNTGEVIYLIARMDTSGSKKTCVFQIYGRPDPNGHTYSFRHETLEEIPIPEPTQIKDRDQQFVTYTDQTHMEFKGAKGYKVRTYLVVKDSRGSVVREEELYVDTYKAQAPKVWVGTTVR